MPGTRRRGFTLLEILSGRGPCRRVVSTVVCAAFLQGTKFAASVEKKATVEIRAEPTGG